MFSAAIIPGIGRVGVKQEKKLRITNGVGEKMVKVCIVGSI